jgi:hypothetical protein
MKKRNELSERNKKLWQLYKSIQFDILMLRNDTLFLLMISLVFAIMGYIGYALKSPEFFFNTMFSAFFFTLGAIVVQYLILNRYKKIIGDKND